MDFLKTYLKKKQTIINRHLQHLIQTADDPSQRLVNAMNYSLQGGGKRLRPILCLCACEIVGGNEEDCLDAACGLEMIHTYSLIHDDLPAMDDDDLRRGKPTCHIAFDEATAILAGDGLLTLGFQLLSCPENGNPTSRLKVVRRVAEAAGYRGMIAGQMLDILSEGMNLSLEDLQNLHLAKTGALIEAAVYVGAVLGGGDNQQLDNLLLYARNIGLAFQVVDDILNVEGDPELMGKAVGTDQDRQKSTYPALIGLAASKQFAGELIESALNALEMFGKEADILRAIGRYIIERNQ